MPLNARQEYFVLKAFGIEGNPRSPCGPLAFEGRRDPRAASAAPIPANAVTRNGPRHLGRGFRKDLAALTEIGPDAINDNSVRQRIGPPYAPTGVWETAWLPTLN